MLECGPHAEHLRVRLRVDETREAVAVGTADARREGRIRLVEHDPAGRVEGLVAGGCEIVRELLDLVVRHRRVWVRSARRRLGRILAPCAVHLVALLGERVVRLELVVRDGPGR
jgi:hypothetical protein